MIPLWLALIISGCWLVAGCCIGITVEKDRRGRARPPGAPLDLPPFIIRNRKIVARASSLRTAGPAHRQAGSLPYSLDHRRN